MKCPNCIRENAASSKFCIHCGNKLQKACNSCGFTNGPNSKFCIECGQALIPKIEAEQALPVSAKPSSLKTAEQRQLTVMVCFIDDESSSSQLNVQQVAKKVVTRYGGHIAQYLPKGIIIYFGYPRGLESAPKAAVQCGVGMIEALKFSNLNQSTAGGSSVKLGIGIHTGTVVMDYNLALGDTVTIASELAQKADESELLVTDSTAKLVEGWFKMEKSQKQLTNNEDPQLTLFKILNQTGLRNKIDLAKAKGLSPFVGREEEMHLLLQAWNQSKGKQGRVVLLSGEAGIGKSRLVERIKGEVSKVPNSWITEMFCSMHHSNTGFYSIIELLERVMVKFEKADSAATKMTKLEGFLLMAGLPLDTNISLFAELLSIPLPEKYTSIPLSPAGKKKKIMGAILQALINRSALQPVMLVIEDLHWSDPSTLEWLQLLVDQIPTYPVLLLCTTRPEFQPQWLGRSHVTRLQLERLSPDKIEAICLHQANGKALPAEVLAHIKSKTDGIPLFIEELTRNVIESGLMEEDEHQYKLSGSLPSLAIPSTLRDSLIARLDKLDTIKELAQIGSVLGREFSYELLKAVSGREEEHLQEKLGQLVAEGLLYQRGVLPNANFIFKHALIQDTAYHSILKARRHLLHHRVAMVLQQHMAEMSKAQPELLAHHLTEAGLTKEAISNWQKAGLLAIQRHANREAIHHLQNGLKLVPQLENEQQQQKWELGLLRILAPTLQLSQGYANKAAGQIAERWLEVAKLSNHQQHTFDALTAQFTYYTFSGNYNRSKEVVAEMKELAAQHEDQYFQLVSSFFSGIYQSLIGELPQSFEDFNLVVQQYNEETDRDRNYYNIGNIKSTALTYGSTSLHLLGQTDTAYKNLLEACDLAKATNRIGSLYSNAAFMSRLLLSRQEYEKVPQFVLPVLKIANENGDVFITGLLSFYLSVAQAHMGDEAAAEKAAQIIPKLYHVYKSYLPAFMVFVADAFRKLGRIEKAQEVIDFIFQHVSLTGEALFVPEAFRIRGLLSLSLNEEHTEASALFSKAITFAKQQNDLWCELLASKDLAQLMIRQGEEDNASVLLEEVLLKFKEGHETQAIKEVKVMLGNLANLPGYKTGAKSGKINN